MSGKLAARAGFLIIFRRVWGSLVNLFVLAWLARQLNVADFGVVAAALFLINISTIITSAGLSDYIIYYHGEDEKRVATSALWLNTLLALVLGGMILLVAPWWSAFYRNSDLTGILQLLVISFVAEMINNVPKAWFRKHLDYRPMVRLQLVFNTLGTLSKVLFVYMGFGVYSLVLPMAVFDPLLAVMLIYKSGLRYEKRVWKDMWTDWRNIYHYTRYLLASRLLTRLINEGDNAIIGKFISLDALGIYNMAFQAANIVTSHITTVVNDVSFPWLAKLKSDMKLFSSTYLNMINMLFYMGMPVIAGSIIFADEIIYILGGDKFKDAVIPLRILSVFTLGRLINSPSGNVFNALGQNRFMFYFNVFYAPVFLLLVWIGSWWGLVAVCITVTGVRLLGSGTMLYYSSRVVGLNLFKHSRDFVPPFISAIAAAAIVFLFHSLQAFPRGWSLIPGGLVFGLLYIGFLKLFFRSAFNDMAGQIISLHPSIKWVAAKTGIFKTPGNKA